MNFQESTTILNACTKNVWKLIEGTTYCCIVICWFMQKYTYIYWIHTDAMIKTQEDFFSKYMYLSLYCKGSKRVTQGLRVRGSRSSNRNCNILTPLLWPSAMCLSRSPGLLNRRPRGPLCWVMAFFTASYQHLLWTPTQSGASTPFGLVWLSLPHLVYNSIRSLTGTVLTSVLTELYNSSTHTQSPTRSLISHVWSSSSGNNCHAVHRSLSSGASVYECTMGIF